MIKKKGHLKTKKSAKIDNIIIFCCGVILGAILVVFPIMMVSTKTPSINKNSNQNSNVSPTTVDTTQKTKGQVTVDEMVKSVQSVVNSLSLGNIQLAITCNDPENPQAMYSKYTNLDKYCQTINSSKIAGQNVCDFYKNNKSFPNIYASNTVSANVINSDASPAPVDTTGLDENTANMLNELNYFQAALNLTPTPYYEQCLLDQKQPNIESEYFCLTESQIDKVVANSTEITKMATNASKAINKIYSLMGSEKTVSYTGDTINNPAAFASETCKETNDMINAVKQEFDTSLAEIDKYPQEVKDKYATQIQYAKDLQQFLNTNDVGCFYLVPVKLLCPTNAPCVQNQGAGACTKQQ